MQIELTDQELEAAKEKIVATVQALINPALTGPNELGCSLAGTGTDYLSGQVREEGGLIKLQARWTSMFNAKYGAKAYLRTLGSVRVWLSKQPHPLNSLISPVKANTFYAPCQFKLNKWKDGEYLHIEIPGAALNRDYGLSLDAPIPEKDVHGIHSIRDLCCAGGAVSTH